MDSEDLKNLKQSGNKIFIGLKGKKGPVAEEKPTINFAFASVAVVKDIQKRKIYRKKYIYS